jgi:hypothetical protein
MTFSFGTIQRIVCVSYIKPCMTYNQDNHIILYDTYTNLWTTYSTKGIIRILFRDSCIIYIIYKPLYDSYIDIPLISWYVCIHSDHHYTNLWTTYSTKEIHTKIILCDNCIHIWIPDHHYTIFERCIPQKGLY